LSIAVRCRETIFHIYIIFHYYCVGNNLQIIDSRQDVDDEYIKRDPRVLVSLNTHYE